MKPLHTSSQVTASDSRMVVRVMEISTPDGPVRRIVVEANAEMDTTEARWLRDKLDLAITLAEGGDARPDCQDCDCRQWTWNGRSHLLRSDPPSACVCGHETVRHHSEGLPVSEDQPKPRPAFVCGIDEVGPDWAVGDRAIWTDEDGEERLVRVVSLYPIVAKDVYGDASRPVLASQLKSEVLADSEQVRHG